MNTFSLVAPAMNAPSGVKDMATTAEFIVIDDRDFASDPRAFQMLMAPSSPADANKRSESASILNGNGNGCHESDVTTPWCALNDL
jgi:hypothetical protein